MAVLPVNRPAAWPRFHAPPDARPPVRCGKLPSTLRRPVVTGHSQRVGTHLARMRSAMVQPMTMPAHISIPATVPRRPATMPGSGVMPECHPLVLPGLARGSSRRVSPTKPRWPCALAPIANHLIPSPDKRVGRRRLGHACLNSPGATKVALSQTEGADLHGS